MRPQLMFRGSNYKDLLNIDSNIALGVEWLYSTWVDNESGTGWGHYSELDRVTEWGGTLDGIRALICSGEDKYDPRIEKAIVWLKSKQQENGGWGSWEIQQSCVEATAWTIITLKLCKEDLNSAHIRRGKEFLIEAAIETTNHCRWGAFKGDQGRIYPTLLAIWALKGLGNNLSAKGALWLKKSINQDHGWGFKPLDGFSNIAMTSMVLYVLLITKNLNEEDPIAKNAIKWIMSHRNVDGTWNNNTEKWICNIDNETNDVMPTQTNHLSISWAIRALIRAGIPVSDKELMDSILALIKMQEKDGSWIYTRDDPQKNIWCAANALIALVDVRNAFISPYGFISFIEPYLIKQMRIITYITIFNFILIGLLIIGIITYISGIYIIIIDYINSIMNIVSSSIKEIGHEVIITVIAAIVLAIAGYVQKRFGRWPFKREKRSLND